MKVVSKIAIVAAAAVGTAAVGSYVGARIIGHSVFEKKIEQLTAKNSNVTHENLEKTFSTRKDKITVKKNNPNVPIPEYEIVMETRFDLSGFHSDFTVNYEPGSFNVLDTAFKITKTPENKGTVDFAYSSETGIVTFENSPFQLTSDDNELVCDIGKVNSSMQFSNAQISREKAKLMDYLLDKEEPIVQKSNVDSVNCTSGGKQFFRIGGFEFENSQTVFSIPTELNFRFNKVDVNLDDYIVINADNAEIGFSLKNSGKGEDDNSFALGYKVNNMDFEMAEPASGNLSEETETDGSGEKADSAAADDTVLKDEAGQKKPVRDKIQVKSTDVVLTFSDLKKQNLDKLFGEGGNQLDSALKDQFINANIKYNILTEMGDSVLNADLKTSNLDMVMYKHDIVINYSVSQKLLKSVKNDELSPYFDKWVEDGYMTLKDGIYSTTLTSKDSFDVFANGKKVEFY